LRKNELPAGWVKTELDNCVDNLDSERIPINTTERAKRKGIIPYYGATGQVGLIDDYLFDEELVLLGEDAAPFFEPFKNKAYLIHGKSWVNNHAHVLKGIKQLMLSKLLCHYLNQFNYHDFVSGTTRLKLNQTSMKKIPLIAPPYNEQKRIVKKIDELFSLIDNNITLLQRTFVQINLYKKSVIYHGFRGDLTTKYRKKESKKELQEKLNTIVEKKKKMEKKLRILYPKSEDIPFQIPIEWEWTTLGLLTQSMKNGIYKPESFYNKNGIACLRMYNIDDGKLNWKNIKRMNLTEEEILEYELKPKDLLINRVNSKELVGKTITIPKQIERCIYESKNIRLRIFEESINDELLSFWFYYFSRLYFSKNAQQTTGMASINQSQISAMPVPFMNLNEQKELVKIIRFHLSQIDKIKNNVECLKQQQIFTKISILKQAFEGELVPQNPDDEPISVLLEKIQTKIKKESKK